MKNFGLIVLFLVSGLGFSFAKDKIKSPQVTVEELKQHVSYLASDALKGRKTGSEGDSLAAEYIRKSLMADGLLPLYDKGFQRLPTIRLREMWYLPDMDFRSMKTV